MTTAIIDKYTYIDQGITLTTSYGNYVNLNTALVYPVTGITVIPNTNSSNVSQLQVNWVDNHIDYTDTYSIFIYRT